MSIVEILALLRLIQNEPISTYVMEKVRRAIDELSRECE